MSDRKMNDQDLVKLAKAIIWCFYDTKANVQDRMLTSYRLNPKEGYELIRAWEERND